MADKKHESTVSRDVSSVIPPKLADLPPFPAVAMKLLALLGGGECSFSTIAACIATDPNLSGQLIRRANCADHPRYCEVRDVRQAAVALGIERTQEISLAAATSAYVSAGNSEILRLSWRHTLACALAASEIARLCGLHTVEAYTAGLLHDIGRLGLITAYRGDYEEIMAVGGESAEQLIQIERERFGVDHMEAGVWLARQWNLPESISESVACHHEKPSRGLDQLAIVQVACRIADAMGFSVQRLTPPADFDEITSVLPESVRKRLNREREFVQAGISREIWIFDRSEPAAARTTSPAEDCDEPQAEEDSPLPPAQPKNAAWIGVLVSILAGLLVSAAIVYFRQ
jgi:putative nucleotidyltransferase with HDIG domain